MPHFLFRCSRQFALAAVVFVTIISALQAQVITPLGSGVEAMFASQSEVFRDSDPTGLIWGSAGPGNFYPVGASLPNLPAPPTASVTTAPGNAFAGTGYTSLFNDNFGTNSYTLAQSTIIDVVSALPLVTSDIQVQFPAWRLEQGPTAPGYAYNQINFGSNYLFTTNPGLAGSVNPALPLLVSGQTIGLTSWAQFDSVIDYSWIPVTTNTAGLIAPSGPAISLGQLSYSLQVSGPAPFLTTLFSSGSLAATPAGDGVLSITGHAWIAGDPFTMNVSSVPEPNAAWLGLCFAYALRRTRRRYGTCRFS